MFVMTSTASVAIEAAMPLRRISGMPTTKPTTPANAAPITIDGTLAELGAGEEVRQIGQHELLLRVGMLTSAAA